MKTILAILITSVFVFSSCNKNQRTVKRIDGKWNVIEANVVGIGEMDPDIIYEFEFCKLKHNDFCDFSMHNFDTDDVQTGVYSIDDFGTTLNVTISDGFGVEYQEFKIERLSTRKMILHNNAATNGQMSRIVLKKVD